jgi:DNA-binding NarL/FixJ family response regulator
MKKKKTRILLVDDHPVVRKGLTALIEEEEDLEVCGEAADSMEALEQIDKLQPDLVVVDISLKKGDGLDLVKQIRSRDKVLYVLVASMHDESLFAERALRAGAQGYINKEEASTNIIAALRQILSNKIYLSAAMTDRLIQRLTNPEAVPGELAVDRLSDRELTVFEQIGQGRTTRQIAEQLHLSIKTVETYRENIKTKLNLANGAELSRHAVQWVLEKR